jgi:hypothetical protein
MSESGDREVDAIRAATRAAASLEIDLSYITSTYLAQQQGAPYPEDVGDSLEGASANAVIATYGGAPLESTKSTTGVEHRYLMFGHEAAKVNQWQWLYRLAEFRDGTWICSPTITLGAGSGQIVATSSEGQPIWEFRL